jgi:A/G-specific adenine glycosylase
MRITQENKAPLPANQMPESMEILRIWEELLGWYDREKRDLPWRRTRDPYRIWVSEVMLQQTRVDTVLPYYQAFLRRFPDVNTLARSRLQSVLKIWEGLGYYGRARNLHKAAKLIVKEYEGCLPDSPKALHQLPGLGTYSVGAIGSIAYNIPLPAVDGNAHRVLSRLFGIQSNSGNHEARRKVDALAKSLVSKGDPPRPGDTNQALMDMGALICLPRKPKCTDCPLQLECDAHLTGQEKSITGSKGKPTPVAITVRCVWAKKKGCVLMAQNPSNGLFGGLWELPGAEHKKNLSSETSLSTQLIGRTGLRITLGAMLEKITVRLTHRRITYQIFEAKKIQLVKQKKKNPGAYALIRWFKLEKLDQLPLPSAQQRILEALLRH